MRRRRGKFEFRHRMAGGATAVALAVLAAVISLACATMVGALTALVVMATQAPLPGAELAMDTADGGGPGSRSVIVRPMRAPMEGECTVVIWNTGMIYCVRDRAAQDSPRAARSDPAVVARPQAVF